MRIVATTYYRGAGVDVKFEHQMLTLRGGEEEAQFVMYEAATGFEKAKSRKPAEQTFRDFQMSHIGLLLTRAEA